MATEYDVEFAGSIFTTTTTSRTFTGLNSDTSFSFRVRARNTSLQSSFSALGSIRTLMLPPLTPTNVRALGITTNQMTIAWDSMARATSYDVNFNGNIFNTTSTSRVFSGLEPNVQHNFSVRAKSESGNSDFSSSRTFWTRRILHPVMSFPSSNIQYSDGRRRITAIDPVDAITGAFYWDYTFLNIDAKDNMNFTVHYNSQNEYNGVLGKGWSHSYNFTLEIYGSLVYFTMPSGEILVFEYDESTGCYIAESKEYELVRISGIYSIKHVSGMEYIFDHDLNIREIRQNGIIRTHFKINNLNQVTEITGQYGSSFTLEYQDNKIANVRNALDHKVSFVYVQDDLLIEAINPEGNRLIFDYDNADNMVTVSDFSGKVYIINNFIK